MPDLSTQPIVPAGDPPADVSGREPVVPFYQRLSVRVALGLVGFLGLTLLATFIAVQKGGRQEIEAQAMRLNAEIGRKIVLNLTERLSAARAVALSVAEISKVLPHEEALFKTVIPQAIDIPGYETLIAGGGYWPEPGQYSPGAVRRSFFWGRNPAGKLAYFDDYNASDGPGYHNEEWYVPARFTRSGDVYWSKSYMDPYSFEPMVTCTAPILIDGKFYGVSTVDLKLTGLAKFMEQQASAIGGYAFALDHNNRLISFPRVELGRRVSRDAAGKRTEEYLDIREVGRLHPGFRTIEENILRHDTARLEEVHRRHGPELATLALSITAGSYQIDAGDGARIAANILGGSSASPSLTQFPIADDMFLKEPGIVSLFIVPGSNWKVVVVTPARQAAEVVSEIALHISLWMGALVLAICVVAYVFFRRQLGRPVGILTDELRALANSDHETGRINLSARNELGQIAYWFNARTEKLAHAMVQLRQKNHALEKATLAAEQASRSKNVFLASMSHEIRTPMNAIIGMSSILKDTRMSPEQAEYAGIISTSANSLLSLINDIMDYSKIEAGKLDLEAIDFDVRTVLEEVSDLVTLTAEQKGLQLICHFNPRAVSFANGDPGRLRQILLNLASNAVKFTASGQVSIYGDIEPDGAGRVGVNFEVKDTGIGIPTEAMSRLFKPFSQGDDSTTRRFGGTGLGLAVSKRLCEMMGGRISVESKAGAGSTFRFHVMMGEAKASDAFPALPTTRHALIVDPSVACRRVLRDILESWSFIVTESSSIEEAAWAIRNSPATNLVFAGVATEVRPALLTRIREEAGSRRLDIVVHANHALISDVEHVIGMLRKPLKYSQLLGMLNRLDTGVRSSAPTMANWPPSTTNREMRILVVDDNLVNQKVIQSLLNRCGVTSDVASDGEQALELVQGIRYGLVLMDWQMPVMDGIEATRRIRTLGGRFSKLPIIASTANAMEGDRDLCLQAGMNDYLSKPITLPKLKAMIDKWLLSDEVIDN